MQIINMKLSEIHPVNSLALNRGRPILQTCAAVLPTGFKRFITAASPKRTGNFLSGLQTAIPRQTSGMEKMEFPMCAELATRGSGKGKNMK